MQENLEHKQSEHSESTKLTNCRYCNQAIPIAASVCYICRRSQKWYFNYFRIADFLLLISICISFGMVYFSYKNTQLTSQNLSVSRREAARASEAANRANEAWNLANQGQDKLTQLEPSVRQAKEDVSRINDLVKQGEAKLRSVTEIAKQAEKAASAINETAEFQILVAKAKDDSRLAFDRLIRISENVGPFQVGAKLLVGEIDKQLTASKRLPYLSPFERYDLDTLTSSIKDFWVVYALDVPKHYRPGFLLQVSSLFENGRFTKKEFLEFLYNVIEHEDSIEALHTACKLIDKEANLHKGVRDYEEYLQWWRTHRDSYD